jgi:predicted nucleotidyltransferase
VRISEAERSAIVAAVRAVFGPEAEVRLFGSRADDRRRGGDIDLHIEAPEALATFHNEIELEARLEKDLGERRVDIVVHPRGMPLGAIDAIAHREGLLL